MSTRDPTGMRLLAVDDEPGALADLSRVLRGLPGVAVVECAGDAAAALRVASNRRFDAVFLDVRMPGLDGLELARVLRRFAQAPELVFVSAHDDAAVEAFELHALDYLRKPVARRRAADALARVLAARATPPNAAAPGATVASGETRTSAPGVSAPARAGEAGRDQPPDAGRAQPPDTGRGTGPGSPPATTTPATEGEVVAVSALRGGATRLLLRGEIRYAHSRGDFVHIVTGNGRYLMRVTLAELERRWMPYGFVRIHRQIVVNLRQAVELRPQLGGTAELAFADGTTVPVARRHVADLARRLGI